MKKKLTAFLIISLSFLIIMGSTNPKPAVAAPMGSTSLAGQSKITSITIKPNTPTKVVNSSIFVTDGQTFEFDLLDINGNPVSYGNYSGTVSVTGPAYFDVYDRSGRINQSAELKIKNGKGKITVYLTTEAYPAEITLTPHFKNLLNKSFTETLYIPGRPGNATQVVLKGQAQDQGKTTFSAETLCSKESKAFLTYSLQAQDALDNPTAMNAPDIMANVSYNGKPSTDVVATATPAENGSYSVTLKLSSEALNDSSEIPVGEYTVTITPKNTFFTTFAPLTVTFTVVK